MVVVSILFRFIARCHNIIQRVYASCPEVGYLYITTEKKSSNNKPTRIFCGFDIQHKNKIIAIFSYQQEEYLDLFLQSMLILYYSNEIFKPPVNQIISSLRINGKK